jgi:hypothetical protein
MFTGELRIVEKNIIKITLYIAIFPLFFSLINIKFNSFFGLLLGLIISFLLFRLKILNLEQALKMNSIKANKYIRNRYLVNYIIYFFVLFVAYKNENLNFVSTVIGLLLMRYTIIGIAIFDILKDSVIRKIKFFEGKEELK